jgi:hypothetical protein
LNDSPFLQKHDRLLNLPCWNSRFSSPGDKADAQAVPRYGWLHQCQLARGFLSKPGGTEKRLTNESFGNEFAAAYAATLTSTNQRTA